MAKKSAKPSSSKSGNKPLVGVIMGSVSDWETMKHCAAKLEELGIPHETKVVSAHRTPELVHTYSTRAIERGLKVIIAGAGGSAHLAGMTAAGTILPVIGVPMMGWSVNGLDSLLSTVNMPGGIPVNTMSIGKAGAINAALSAASIIALNSKPVRDRLSAFRKQQTENVLATEIPSSQTPSL